MTTLVHAASPMWDGLVALLVSVFIFLGAVIQLLWRYLVRRRPRTRTGKAEASPAATSTTASTTSSSTASSSGGGKVRWPPSTASEDGPRSALGEDEPQGDVAEDVDGNPLPPVRRGSSAARIVYKDPVRASRQLRRAFKKFGF